MFARTDGESVLAGCSIFALQEQNKIATSRVCPAGVKFEDDAKRKACPARNAVEPFR
jgi:hypothetical protein